MSDQAAQPASDQPPPEEIARAAIDAAFAEAHHVMMRHGLPAFGQSYEFMVHAVDHYAGREDTRAQARAKVHQLVETCLDYLFEGEEDDGDPAAAAANAEPALDPEAHFVARLALDGKFLVLQHEANPSTQQELRRLLSEGKLRFINGGWIRP